MSENWIVFERVRPDTRCASKHGDAEGCDGGGCDDCDVPGCDGGGRDGCDGGGSDGCYCHGCNDAGYDGGGSDSCDGGRSDGCDCHGCNVADCDGGGSDSCDGGRSDGCDSDGCNVAGYDGGGSDGGVYAMVNPGVVVGAAAFTEPTEPPAPAGCDNGGTGVRGTIHTMSLEKHTPPVELLRTFTVDKERL